MAPPLSHAAATRRHAILTQHGLTYTNSEGILLINKVNDTFDKWLAAQRVVWEEEGKGEVTNIPSTTQNNALRSWYKKNKTPPSLDTIVYSDISLAAAKEFLRNYRRSFINITNITGNITLPSNLHKSWKNELSQHNNEACNLLKFMKRVFTDSSTSDDCRDVLQELKREFGIMLPTEFDAKYNDIINNTNRFGCFGDMNWKTVIFLEHAEFPLAEKEQRYPPLADMKKAFRDVVNSRQYGFIKALVFDEGQRQRSIVRKGLEHDSFYAIIKPYWNKVTTSHPLHKHYHRAKDVIAKNNSNRLCTSDCPHCALFRRSDADDTDTAADTATETAVSRDMTEAATTTDELHEESTGEHPRVDIMHSTIHHIGIGKDIKAELEKKFGKEGWKRTWERLERQIPYCVLLCVMAHMQEDCSMVYQYLESLDEDESSNADESTWANHRRVLLHHQIRLELHQESGATCLFSDLRLDMFSKSSTASHHVFKHFMIWLMMPVDQPDLIIDTRKTENVSVIVATATSFMDLIQRYAHDSTLCVDIFGLDHNFLHWLEKHPKLIQKLGFELPKCVTVKRGEEEVSFMVLSLETLPTVKSLVDECIKNEKKLTEFDRVELAPGKADLSISSDYGIKKLVDDTNANTIDHYFLLSRDKEEADTDEDDESSATDDSFDEEEEEKTPKVKSSSTAVTESDRPTKKAKKEEDGSGSDDDEEMEGSDDEEIEAVQRVVKVNPSADGDDDAAATDNDNDEGAEDSSESNEEMIAEDTEPAVNAEEEMNILFNEELIEEPAEPVGQAVEEEAESVAEEDAEESVAEAVDMIENPSLSFNIPHQVDPTFPGIEENAAGSAYKVWSVKTGNKKTQWNRQWQEMRHKLIQVMKGIITADGGWNTEDGWNKVAGNKALRGYGWDASMFKNVYNSLQPGHKMSVEDTLKRLKPKKKTE